MGVLQDVSKWHWCSGLVTQTFGARRERPDARDVGDTACGTLLWAGGIFPLGPEGVADREGPDPPGAPGDRWTWPRLGCVLGGVAPGGLSLRWGGPAARRGSTRSSSTEPGSVLLIWQHQAGGRGVYQREQGLVGEAPPGRRAGTAAQRGAGWGRAGVTLGQGLWGQRVGQIWASLCRAELGLEEVDRLTRRDLGFPPSRALRLGLVVRGGAPVRLMPGQMLRALGGVASAMTLGFKAGCSVPGLEGSLGSMCPRHAWGCARPAASA